MTRLMTYGPRFEHKRQKTVALRVMPQLCVFLLLKRLFLLHYNGGNTRIFLTTKYKFTNIKWKILFKFSNRKDKMCFIYIYLYIEKEDRQIEDKEKN